MVLTQRQEAFILHYLRDVGAFLDKKLSESLREQALTQLKNTIYHELTSFKQEALEDADVQKAVAQFGSPATQAAQLLERRNFSRELTLDVRHRLWLGVCAGVARRLDLEPWLIRTLAIAAGVTGPLAILVYLALYLYMYNTSGPYAGPQIDKGRLALRIGGTFGGVIALRLAAVYALRLVDFAHEQVLHRPPPALGEWAWLEANAGDLFFWSLVTCVPLAALSAMPLANAWDQSIKRFSQALLALYGVALSFGVASEIVGIILISVKEFTG